MKTQSLGVIVPVYKGGLFLDRLVQELRELKKHLATQKIGIELVEVLFVDDCSIDNSWEILQELGKKHKWIKLIRMLTNSGQHPATLAGLKQSTADWLITMDEDLQHRPKQITKLWEQCLNAQSDLVYANPSGPVHQSKPRNWFSRTAKKIIASLTGRKEIMYFNSFRLINREIVDKISLSPNKHIYLDSLLINQTKNISKVDLNLIDIRKHYKEYSNYNYPKLFIHFKNLTRATLPRTILILKKRNNTK